MINTRSIRFRLTVWYAGILTVVFVLAGFAIHAGLKHYLEHNLRETLDRRARLIGATLLAAIDRTGEAYVIEQIQARFTPELTGRFIRITRHDGSLLYRSGPPSDAGFDPKAVPHWLQKPLGPVARKEKLPGGRELLIVAEPSGKDGRFVIEMGASSEPIRAALRQWLVFLALGLPVVVLMAVGGGYLLLGAVLAPVEEITRSAERITSQNLAERLPPARTGDELERLSASLNRMIARLDEAFQQNKRFVADASHELRTPLTILRGELEAVLDRKGIPSDLRDLIGSALEEVERLAKIVESLFALSRLDAGEAKSERVHFNLAEMATSTAEQMRLLAEDKGLSLCCHAPDPVMVEGDRARLKQVVVNLLDNAIKYTLKDGVVRLAVQAVDGVATLVVEDNGIGIPPDALPHVFERFYRVDRARSREMGGAGIGLSIVQSICAAHNGRACVQSKEGAGSRFCVELPLAASVQPESFVSR